MVLTLGKQPNSLPRELKSFAVLNLAWTSLATLLQVAAQSPRGSCIPGAHQPLPAAGCWPVVLRTTCDARWSAESLVAHAQERVMWHAHGGLCTLLKQVSENQLKVRQQPASACAEPSAPG